MKCCRPVKKIFREAEKQNPWFRSGFVNLIKGDPLHLPVEDHSIDEAAQNCLFNIFKRDDLHTALKEMYKVLNPHGRLVLSDPICEQEIPEQLREDERLKALCLSGSLPLKEYRPYRVLAPANYDTEELIYTESVEVCAIKDPFLSDGPCVFTERAAIYYGQQDGFDDEKGHVLLPISR